MTFLLCKDRQKILRNIGMFFGKEIGNWHLLFWGYHTMLLLVTTLGTP